MKEEPPSVAKTFIARRIAEFPTLHSHGDQVIFSDVISTQGSCYWDKKGHLQMQDQHWDDKRKKFTKYPLAIPMEAAYKLVHSHGKSINPYYNMTGPINRMPPNTDDSWLLTLSIFLTKWGKFTMDDFRELATMKCMLYYGVKENPNAGLPQRTIEDFAQFHKKIPSWKAMIESIHYQKEHSKVDPRTYLGIDI